MDKPSYEVLYKRSGATPTGAGGGDYGQTPDHLASAIKYYSDVLLYLNAHSVLPEIKDYLCEYFTKDLPCPCNNCERSPECDEVNETDDLWRTCDKICSWYKQKGAKQLSLHIWRCLKENTMRPDSGDCGDSTKKLKTVPLCTERACSVAD